MTDANGLLARLQAEAAFGRAVLDLVKGSGLAKPKKRRRTAKVKVAEHTRKPGRVKRAVTDPTVTD